MDETQNIKVGKDIKQINLECEEGTLININAESENGYLVVAGLGMIQKIQAPKHCGYEIHIEPNYHYIFVPIEDFEDSLTVEKLQSMVGYFLSYNGEQKKWFLLDHDSEMMANFSGILGKCIYEGKYKGYVKVYIYGVSSLDLDNIKLYGASIDVQSS